LLDRVVGWLIECSHHPALTLTLSQGERGSEIEISQGERGSDKARLQD